MPNDKWLMAVIVVGSIALLAGMATGRSNTEEAYQRLISRAGLSTECRLALEQAAQEKF